ncbi:MAG: ABC transporter permease subunit [Clostridiales bacterium]|jgi:NitT/TauT family transport system permease protein|nr:ABC transporter permease subunit [Clostridiales bacterium]
MISILSDKKSRQKLAVVLFWLTIWQIASIVIGHDLLLVSPIKVAKTLLLLIQELSFWSAIAYTFVRIVCGFLLSILIGILLAALSAASGILKALLAPFFGVVKSVPVVSFIILVLIWSGNSNLSIVISFLMVLPIIYTNVLEGIERTDIKLLEMAHVFNVSFLNIIKYIYIPSCMPYFLSACKVGLGLCWKSGIAAEVIGLPTGSIGEKLYQSKIFLSTAELFSWTIVIITISFLFEKLFLWFLKRIEKKLERSFAL